MMNDKFFLEAHSDQWVTQIQSASSTAELEFFRLEILGKKGQLTARMKELGQLDPEARTQQGGLLNQLKDQVLGAIQAKQNALENELLEIQLKEETLDVTLASDTLEKGSIHPLSRVQEEIAALFLDMGFCLEEGPDIEDEYHNFTALNIPENHPARQEHDTFYLKNSPPNKTFLLRTQTSPVQIRTLTTQKPPIRMIAMGRTFRSDSDMTHSPMFHQLEGLVIDKNIHMGHLKKCLLDFLGRFFEIDPVPLRFRPSYFPFTEPSAEVDIGYERQGNALVLGGKGDWLEIMGCGMVHPTVIKNCGLNPDEYQGFAFGMGIERLTMLKYGISDLRTLYEGDVRWLKHFGFKAFDIPSFLSPPKKPS